jgi:hypothetical protein
MTQVTASLVPSTSTSNAWARPAPVTATVQIRPEGVAAEILDARPECIAGFGALEPGAQQLLVHDVWTIGMRAVLNARAEAQEAQLSNIAQTFQENLADQLERQTKQATELVQGVLAEYFDPESGCVGERLKHFVGDDGVLTHQLRRHLGAENSTLAATLAKNVGEQSPLFKKLSPTESEGIVQTLAQQLRRVLHEEHGEFQKALDPLQAEGAVGKFLAEMRRTLQEAESDEAQQIKLALKHLDANDEQSLLSQLRRDMVTARAELLRAINPAHEDSPLAAIQRTLTKLLEAHVKTQQEREESARKREEAFHADVRERLERIETRKRVEQRTNLGGRPFEQTVVAFIQRVLGPTGYLVEPTGDFPGARRKKVGDATIDFPVDHPFHGCRIVVEAKHEEKLSPEKARAELDEARANRDAQVGLFVLAKSHAPDTFPTFQRCGHDVLLVWDEEDPHQAPYLEGALMVALALATRKQATASEGDLKALSGVEERVTKEIARLERVKKLAESIRLNAEKIAREVGQGEDQLRGIVDDAKATLTALSVELVEVELEHENPIVMNVG